MFLVELGISRIAHLPFEQILKSNFSLRSKGVEITVLAQNMTACVRVVFAVLWGESHLRCVLSGGN
eukprot:6485110-Amphidinium_carterae.1